KSHSNSFLGGFRTIVSGFFAEVPGAIKGHLNIVEPIRIAVMALAAGGGIFGLLQAIELNVGQIFPAPADAGLASAVLTLLLDVPRRPAQGPHAPSPGRPKCAPSRRGGRNPGGGGPFIAGGPGSFSGPVRDAPPPFFRPCQSTSPPASPANDSRDAPAVAAA